MSASGYMLSHPAITRKDPETSHKVKILQALSQKCLRDMPYFLFHNLITLRIQIDLAKPLILY